MTGSASASKAPAGGVALVRKAASKPFVAALFVLGIVVLWFCYLGTPWSRVPGFADWIGAQNARITSNMVAVGTEGRGAQLLNLEAPRTPDEWILYHGHPPTLDLMTSLAFRVTSSRHVAVQRALPLLAALASIVLLFLLARRLGVDAWTAVGFFVAYPLVGAHGINFSYEPLCLAALLGLVLLFAKGWRYRLLPLFFVFGLLDFPVLYLGPHLALVHVVRERSRGSLVFVGAFGLACVLSLGLTLAHVVWSGQAAGTPGQDVVQKILRSFAPKRGFEPAWGTYFEAWVRALVDGLAWPGLVLAVLALLWLALHGRRGSAAYERRLGFGPGFGIGAFAFVGVLHCALFRAHFVLHDFWAFYLTPAAALASAAFAQRLTTLLRVALLLVVGGFGFAGSLAVWQERAAPPVREVAGDLAALADEATVFHQLRAPAGWAIENERGHPVYEGMDLVLHLSKVASEDAGQQAEGLAGYRRYIDNLAGARGDLSRPQRAFLYVEREEPGDAGILRTLLTADAGAEQVGPSGARYRFFDLDSHFFDPRRFPAFARVSDVTGARLGQRAALLAGLDELRKAFDERGLGRDFAFFDGTEAEGDSMEVFRGMRFRQAGPSEWAARLANRGASELPIVSVADDDRELEVAGRASQGLVRVASSRARFLVLLQFP